mgnify:CR=1 FL=1
MWWNTGLIPAYTWNNSSWQYQGVACGLFPDSLTTLEGLINEKG